MHVGLSEIDRERNDLAAARKHLDAAESLGEAMGLPQNPYRLRVAGRESLSPRDEPDEAVSALDEAEQRYDGDFSPNVRPIAALRARVWVQQGRLAEARAWSRDVAVAADDELTYLREFEHGTLARLLLAEGVRDRDDDTDRCGDPPRGSPVDVSSRRRAARECPGCLGRPCTRPACPRRDRRRRRGSRPGRRPRRTGSLGPGVPRRRGSDDGAAERRLWSSG